MYPSARHELSSWEAISSSCKILLPAGTEVESISASLFLLQGSPFFDPEDLFKEKDSKKVHCYTCGASHEWTKVDRPKNRCRWCAVSRWQFRGTTSFRIGEIVLRSFLLCSKWQGFAGEAIDRVVM
jgi:hypothetical protein